MSEATDGAHCPEHGSTRGATWARFKRAARLGALSVATVAAMLPGGAIASATPSAPALTVNSPSGNAYIVRASGNLSDAKHDVVQAGGQVGADLSIINGFSATLSPSEVEGLSSSPDIATITPDRAMASQGSTYNVGTDAGGPVGLSNDIGYNAYWNARFSGQGIGVALIDSGVAPVPALSASGKVVYGPDFTPTGYFTAVRGLDTFGHGTFMAGLIAGRDPGAAAPYDANSGRFLGVAPDAHIVSVKVSDASGATMESAVIAGIGWVVQHRNDPGLNIRVMNLSLGVRSGLPYTQDPLDAAAEAAWKAGITVVAAAGNDGQVGMTAPANDPYVVAVAGVDTGSTISVSDDKVASFSDVGDGTRNPDFGVLATHIVSTRVQGSAIDQAYGSGGGSINSALMRGSGTSEAAAITSGAVALLLSQRPSLTPDQVKATLSVHAMWLPNLTQQNAGAGELNMGWVFNAATEYRTQNWPSAGASSPTSSTVLNAPASTKASAATWTGATWTNANWSGATWTGATWTGATWTNANWSGATWTGATWTGATWTSATWTAHAWTTQDWE